MSDQFSENDLEQKFDENWYLAVNADVRDAVRGGHFPSGFAHYVAHGRAERRSICDPWPVRRPRFHFNSKELDGQEKIEKIKIAKTILVRRTSAMGDAIMATPVLARLRHMVGPDVRVDFQSEAYWALAGNPHINRVRNNSEPVAGDYELFIDLNNTYDQSMKEHAVEAYMIEAFGNFDWDRNNIVLIKRHLPAGINLDWRRAVAIHPASTDKNRTVREDIWKGLIYLLLESNLIPVILGSYREITLDMAPGVVDLTGKLTIQQTATAIQSSLCLVSADTGLTHVAGSTDTPMVTIYTAVPPEHRMPWRYGQMGWRVTSLVPKLECVGCYGGPYCKRDDYACVEGKEAIDVKTLFNAVMETIKFHDHTEILKNYTW